MKDNYKDEPSLIIINDFHHWYEKRQTIDDLEAKGSDKPILVLNTDKHRSVRIVTPDVTIFLYSGKGKKHKHSTDIRICPNLWDEKERIRLSLSSFDDMREANLEVFGERVEDWENWKDTDEPEKPDYKKQIKDRADPNLRAPLF